MDSIPMWCRDCDGCGWIAVPNEDITVPQLSCRTCSGSGTTYVMVDLDSLDSDALD